MSDVIHDEPKNDPAASSAVETIVMPRSFPQVLKHFGFKRLKQHHKGIIPWGKGKMYVEVYSEGYAWGVGGDMKTSYLFPGGYAYDTPKELFDELEEIGA